MRGGENISPAEVEAVLLAQPSIADAAVVARRDEVLGQVPVAAIVVRPDAADPGDDAILLACRASLAGFKVPAAIVRLDALPRTSGGKLRRDAVRALVDGGPAGVLARPGGDEIGWRVTGSGSTPVVLLPGTLSNAAQLDRLATELARPGDATVHAIDRRGMGTSRLAAPGRPGRRRARSRPRRLPRRPRDRPRGRGRRQLRRGGRARGGGPTPGPRRDPRRLGAAVRAARRRRVARPVREAGRGHRRGPTTPAARPPRPRRSCARSPATPPGTGCRPRAATSSPARVTPR